MSPRRPLFDPNTGDFYAGETSFDGAPVGRLTTFEDDLRAMAREVGATVLEVPTNLVYEVRTLFGHLEWAGASREDAEACRKALLEGVGVETWIDVAGQPRSVRWRCHAKPASLGGRTCGHEVREPIAGREGIPCCSECGATKKASDDREARAGSRRRGKKASDDAGSPRLCPGCRGLDGVHDLGSTCTLREDGES